MLPVFCLPLSDGASPTAITVECPFPLLAGDAELSVNRVAYGKMARARTLRWGFKDGRPMIPTFYALASSALEPVGTMRLAVAFRADNPIAAGN